MLFGILPFENLLEITLCVMCDMTFIELMLCNKPNITFLFLLSSVKGKKGLSI